MVWRIQAKVFLVYISKILKNYIGEKKMNFTQTVIWEIGQTKGHPDRKNKNLYSEFFEVFSHNKLWAL